MRPLNDSPSFSPGFEVLDGDDLPDSWVGRKVGAETLTASEVIVGWLQSKSTWRLVVVDERTGEPRYVPWVALEAIFLLEEEPEGASSPQGGEAGSETGSPCTDLQAVAHSAYERFLRGPVMVVLAVLWVGELALLGLCALALYLAGSVLI